jgi:hypothetical protein
MSGGPDLARRHATFARFAGILTVVFGLPLLAAGCGGIGPHTVPNDRFDYTEAISSSWKQQMLVNMVKLRYGDTPVFLDVVSVINQYAAETSVDLRGTWVDPVASIGDSASIGGSARYSDKPTITYAPLTGERFARSLMRPIPPTAVLSLIQTGYPVDAILRVCAHSINGIRNRYGGASRARPADPQFYPLLARMRKVQDSGSLGLRVLKANETNAMEGTLLTFRGKADPSQAEDVGFIRQTLGLDQAATEFRIAYGSVAKDDKEIAILTRSMLEILIDLGSYVDVPDEHVRQRRVGASMAPEASAGAEVAPLLRVFSSSHKPGDSFVAVPYRGHWYWIDDGDLRSKTLFSFLMFVFSLTETEGRESAPIVTIPAG